MAPGLHATLLFGNPLGSVMSDEEVRAAAMPRLLSSVMAIGIDVFIVATFRGAPGVRGTALAVFAVCNIGLLSLSAVVTALGQRWARRPARWISVWFAPLMEAVTTLTWVQLTGSVSSYFIIFELVMIFFWRISTGYLSALVGTVALFLGHGAVFAAEEVGFFPQASVFLTPPGGLYAAPVFRHAAILSILGTVFLTFGAANYLVNSIKGKDLLLAKAKKDLARAVDLVRQGRLTGESLGGYVLGELLGRGGMGEVYAALNASGDEFAVKVLYPHLAAEEESFSRFRREWDVAFRLSGRYTPNVLEIAESPEGPYIVMERLRGEDLGAFLRRRDKLSKEELLPLMQSLAVALDEIHGAGVVHRDLKPANVFLLPDGSLRLLDFGIARFRESTGTLTADAQVLGTPGYLAPEQARGEKGRIGPGTDVFALGVIFYRALTGVLPFSGRTALEAIDEVCRGNHRPPSTLVEGVPKEVDAVLAVVFAKDILRRYASAGAFVRDLAAALRGEIAPSLQERAAPLASPLSTPLSDPRTLVLPTSRSPR